MLPLLWSWQLLSVDSHKIIKAKSPTAIHQSLRSFAGLMVAPEGGIRTGPRSARVKARSLTPYRDYCPPGCSQRRAQHLIDINSLLNSGPPPHTHNTHTHIWMLNSFQVWMMTPQTSRASSAFPVPLLLWVIFLEFWPQTSTLPCNWGPGDCEKWHLWSPSFEVWIGGGLLAICLVFLPT